MAVALRGTWAVLVDRWQTAGAPLPRCAALSYRQVVMWLPGQKACEGGNALAALSTGVSGCRATRDTLEARWKLGQPAKQRR